MAGRGRGRGKSNLSFDVSSLGFGAGEALPTQTLQPPSLFPPLQQRPTPLASTEVDEYLLALSQEYRLSIKDSPFYLKAKSFKKDITRYTDRYKQGNQNNGDSQQWEPDWNYLPEELKPAAGKKTGRKSSYKVVPTVVKRTNVDVVKKLEELGQKELKETTAVNVENENEEEKGEGEGEEIEDDQDEEYEDDNDYNFDYYDDGGDNYGDDDDGEEGPIY